MPSCEKGSHFSGVSLKNWSFERSTMDAKRIVWVTFIRLFLSPSLHLLVGHRLEIAILSRAWGPSEGDFPPWSYSDAEECPVEKYTSDLCTYAWEICAQIRLKVKGRMRFMDQTYWSSSIETLQVNSCSYRDTYIQLLHLSYVSSLYRTSK